MNFEELDLEKWQKFERDWKIKFLKKPTIESVLLIVGWQEVPQVKQIPNKQTKEDLLHVGFCKILSLANYFTFSHLDDEGWPHYKTQKELPKLSLREQEVLLKKNILLYFG